MMVMMNVASPAWMAVVMMMMMGTSSTSCSAFSVTPPLSSTSSSVGGAVAGVRKRSTRLFLEDWVAEMIDEEKWREEHKKEFENAWMEKNRGAVLHSIRSSKSDSTTSGGTTNLMMDDQEDYRFKVKDRNLAAKDPQAYCADRCLATGNCDVYEDFFDLSPQDVRKFCEECVLSDGEEPCDVPEVFYDNYEDFGSSSSGLKP